MTSPLSNRVAGGQGTNILHSANNMVMAPSPTNWYNHKKQLVESASRKQKNDLNDSALERRFMGEAPQITQLNIDMNSRQRSKDKSKSPGK